MQYSTPIAWMSIEILFGMLETFYSEVSLVAEMTEEKYHFNGIISRPVTNAAMSTTAGEFSVSSVSR